MNRSSKAAVNLITQSKTMLYTNRHAKKIGSKGLCKNVCVK